MSLLNLDQVRASLKSKVEKNKELRDNAKLNKGFHEVADLLQNLLNSALLERLDETEIKIAKCYEATDSIFSLYICENCILIKNYDDDEDWQTFSSGEEAPEGALYNLAKKFKLIPESVQELITLLEEDSK